MGKAQKTFFAKKHKTSALGTIVSDEGWRVKDVSPDQRVTHLLMLMRQIDESAGGLGTLPMSELSEIVCSAIELCGFEDPVEARDVIKTVLQTIELSNQVPRIQNPDSAAPSSGLSRQTSLPEPRSQICFCGGEGAADVRLLWSWSGGVTQGSRTQSAYPLGTEMCLRGAEIQSGAGTNEAPAPGTDNRQPSRRPAASGIYSGHLLTSRLIVWGHRGAGCARCLRER